MTEKFEKQVYFTDDKNKLLAEGEAENLCEDLNKLREEPINEEIEKPQNLLELISSVNGMIKSYVKQEYGMEVGEFTSQEVHLYDKDGYCRKFQPDERLAGGIVDHQGIHLMDDFIGSPDDLKAAVILAHEAFHQLAVLKYAVRGRNLTPYRKGLRMKHGDRFSQEGWHFSGLDEGMTDFLTIDFYFSFLHDNPKYQAEVNALKEQLTAEQTTRSAVLIPGVTAYTHVRELVFDLMRKLYEVNQDKFEKVEDVRNQLVKSYFAPDTMAFARLINSLGQNCFQELADIGSEQTIENVTAVINFRRKHNLKEDPKLNELLEILDKNRTDT